MDFTKKDWGEVLTWSRSSKYTGQLYTIERGSIVTHAEFSKAIHEFFLFKGELDVVRYDIKGKAESCLFKPFSLITLPEEQKYTFVAVKDSDLLVILDS